MRIDWTAPVGRSAEAIRCVPGLTLAALSQWQARGRLARRGGGKGRPMVWHADDVLELATRAELSRLGALPAHIEAVWAVVRGALLARRFPGPADRPGRAVFLAVSDGGEATVRPFNESAADDAPDGAGLRRDDAPAALLYLRVDRLIDRTAVRIAAVAPAVVLAP